jgi:hypothetical protein
MAEKYALINKVVGSRGAFKADLAEDGVIVARVRRLAPTKGFHSPFEIERWYSSRAAARFDSYCDTLFACEVLECLAD